MDGFLFSWLIVIGLIGLALGVLYLIIKNAVKNGINQSYLFSDDEPLNKNEQDDSSTKPESEV